MTGAILAILLAAAGPAKPAPPLPPLEVLEAGVLDYDVATDRGVVTGGVVLRRGLVMLRAKSARYDARTGEVDAYGDVLLTEPGRVVSAAAMHAMLDGPFKAHDVVAFMKETPLDLSRCKSLDEGKGIGRNALTFGGRDVTREPPGPGGADRYEIESARVTLCDCGAGPPSWEIRSHSADVIPGQRAILWWPVIYLTPRFLFIDTPVPVLALPALYYPLTDRQSGLLMPQLSFGGMAGFGISQPLYLTLGQSWDATISADYIFGPTTEAAKGAGTSLELRWAPVEGMYGQLHASILHSDVHTWPSGVAPPPGWNRIAISGYQNQRVSDDTYYRLELGLVGDPLYLQDFTGDALLRAIAYRRNAFAISHRTDDLVLEADAAYYLPLVNLDSGTATPARFGLFGTDLSTFHRLPSASVTLTPVPIAGPVRFSLTTGVARFAPLHGATGDEGVNGIGTGDRGWTGAAVDAGENDGRWTPPSAAGPGERLAATRALVRAELRAPMEWGQALSVEPWVTGTAASYAFETALAPQVDAHAVAGLVLSTRLGRSYGDGASRVRHEIEPRVEWRGGTASVGPGLPNFAYDEYDVALPPRMLDGTGAVALQRMLSAIPGSFSQLSLSVRNRLIVPAGALSTAFVDLTVGQDLDAATGQASETWAEGSLRMGPVAASGYARWRSFGAAAPPTTPPPPSSSPLDTFTALSANLTVFDSRGDNVHGNFLALGPGGSPRMLAGLDAIFDPRPYDQAAIAQGQLGLAARWGAAILGYDAFFTARSLAAPYCPGKSTGPHVFQQIASVVWDSPCHCWKAGLNATLNECDDRPRVGFVIDMSSVTSHAGGH